MGRNYYNWPAIIAELQVQPGRWELMFPDHPARLVSSIRLRRHPLLRRIDGQLEATIVNEYREPGERARGDVWVRWVPYTKT